MGGFFLLFFHVIPSFLYPASHCSDQLFKVFFPQFTEKRKVGCAEEFREHLYELLRGYFIFGCFHS